MTKTIMAALVAVALYSLVGAYTFWYAFQSRKGWVKIGHRLNNRGFGALVLVGGPLVWAAVAVCSVAELVDNLIRAVCISVGTWLRKTFFEPETE